MVISRGALIRALIGIHYERTNADLSPGVFRAIGNTIELMPQSERVLYRIEFSDDLIERIQRIDPISRRILEDVETFFVFPAKHFITPEAERKRAIETIRIELKKQLKRFEKEGKPLEAERLKRRTNYALAMLREVGYCNGIENYSRHFSGAMPGEPPDTLLSYFKGPARSSISQSEVQNHFLTIIDESHVTVPQLHGMYAGDQSRKNTLVDHGFRLPSARDNRPLQFHEFEERVGQVIFTSATPGPHELEKSGKSIIEQVIRPTGLVDPEIVVKPVVSSGKPYTEPFVGVKLLQRTKYGGQIQDFIGETEKVIKRGERAIATTLTKKMAEDLTEYLKKKGIKTEYLHSDIETLERITILTNFRKGVFDVIVGVNLLREGLDLPEVSLIGILDADKEGFLRSDTALIQTIGRAARNISGRVILYADIMTGSMKRAICETNRRRTIQLAYNKRHGITPKTIIKKIHDITETLGLEHKKAVAELIAIDKEALKRKKPQQLIKEKKLQMNASVKILDFETAALLRDEINELEKLCVV